jgi:tRNA threonylcarbamoyladenosine biosynthesis protein TsaE
MSTITFHSTSEADTQRLGSALAAVLPASATVGLDGPLGAGKTRLVQAVAQAVGIDPREVVSPTFVLMHEYHGERTLYHIDAYRLRNPVDFLDLGVDDSWDQPVWILIEWSEKVAEYLPAETVKITITATGENERQFAIASDDAAMLNRLAEALR